MASSDFERNRAFWNSYAAEYHERNADFIAAGLAWGLWQIPESELRILGDVAGKDVLELGCGEAEWGRALAGLGARVVGLDASEARLEGAREAGAEFPLVHAPAERVPLPDASFDVVFADHGAPSFADPYLVVPEVARLLRPGGAYAFSAHSPLAWICLNREEDRWDEELHAPLFGMHRLETPEGTVEFNPPHGEWVRLFRANGFRVERLVEVQPPERAASSYRDERETAWARRWPMEQIWVVRLR
jgi:ubiquinone/menaquinone biosynthesis C-methylase UbiE